MADRLCCAVPYCRRTHHNREGYSMWICPKHWRLVPRKWRRLYSARRRAFYTFPTPRSMRAKNRAWERCLKHAVTSGGLHG